MSEGKMETSPPPSKFNPEKFEPYKSPFTIYKVKYPINSNTTERTGYTIDKYWHDVCQDFGWPTESNQFETVDQLSRAKSLVVAEYGKYGGSLVRKHPKDEITKDEIKFWWTGREGKIDNNTTPGDPNSTEVATSTTTIGSINENLARMAKILYEVGAVDERLQILDVFSQTVKKLHKAMSKKENSDDSSEKESESGEMAL
ncbi:hypothetical protein N0V83_010992 [Neocucurbitaria cava]|uniref:Uncharacterized protein n=1 Tax=Neocucurbitaria cava TaxID=798079 RepID=A0A9W8XZE6_9PLEO|nr:hypothetical protein N0V83_010992 [Neocucurbitaria cava]